MGVHGDRKGEGAVLLVNVWHPVVTNGILCVRGGDAALPRLLWDFLSQIVVSAVCGAYRICDSVTIVAAYTRDSL